MSTVDRIMALSGSMPNPLAHRHWLEQLPPRHQKARLDDLIESEERFLKRDPFHVTDANSRAIHNPLIHS